MTLFLGILSCLTQAEIPKTISYQGYLTNAAGEPLEGNVTITFSIVGTNWTETHIITVVKGVFSQVLGETDSFEGKVDFSQPYELKVKPIVNAKLLEVDPTPFSSVPYAFYSDHAEQVDEPTLGKLECSEGQVPAWNATTKEWFCSNNIPGPKGDKGDKGDRGPKGDTESAFSGSQIKVGGRCFEPQILYRCINKPTSVISSETGLCSTGSS